MSAVRGGEQYSSPCSFNLLYFHSQLEDMSSNVLRLRGAGYLVPRIGGLIGRRISPDGFHTSGCGPPSKRRDWTASTALHRREYQATACSDLEGHPETSVRIIHVDPVRNEHPDVKGADGVLAVLELEIPRNALGVDIVHKGDVMPPDDKREKLACRLFRGLCLGRWMGKQKTEMLFRPGRLRQKADAGSVRLLPPHQDAWKREWRMYCCCRLHRWPDLPSNLVSPRLSHHTRYLYWLSNGWLATNPALADRREQQAAQGQLLFARNRSQAGASVGPE